ncbi:WhiB family transcriptional regulator [Streptomyces sp. NPDC058718]|uniref:WhiB family transcriptional regulator n=1 Tax=Streptomyces sp. NPDC058718 TaxID=3346610 RepID=UPI0036BB06ED
MITLAIPLAIAEQAVCGQVDPELFFPEKGGSVKEPKLLCAVCPVRQECLAWALDHDVRHGVWGGLSQKELSRLRRQAVDAA